VTCHLNATIFGHFSLSSSLAPFSTVVFSGVLLVAWEHCISVSVVPDHVPAVGEMIVEYNLVTMFREAISRPIGFTTCVARHDVPLRLPPDDEAVHWGMEWDWGAQQKLRTSLAPGVPPTLTITARSRRQAETISIRMLVPFMDKELR